MPKVVCVIDCQKDFIDGSLACINSEEAVDNIINYINITNDIKEVRYSLDWHSLNHCSFKLNGGMWPSHCVNNTIGATLSNKFFYNILRSKDFGPNPFNTYYKGSVDSEEEYSAYNAFNLFDEKFNDFDAFDDEPYEFIFCGIATEFCVKETVLEFLKLKNILSNVKITLLKDCLGYVSEEGHLNTIKELGSKGVNIV